jgi:hypothetical protein
LPGLAEAEMLFQIHADGLRASFPKPRIGRPATARRTPADRRVASKNGARRDEGQLELPHSS